MCTILMASFFHLEQNVRTSEVGPNFKSVIDVVRFIIVFSGFVKALKDPPDPSEEILKMFTVPILLPVARCLPSGLTSIVVV
jgi:hypothetical protein